MKEPEFVKLYREDAERYLAEGRVRDIEFSGGTYQVQVVSEEDEPEDVWAFFQLDEDGGAKDYFCSCSEADEDDHCAHLAAAYLAVFRGQKQPLHQRFTKSFWNQLFHAFAEGREEAIPQYSDEGVYELRDDQGQLLFSASSPKRKDLSGLFEDRPEQTEETSLKFSNLDEEEIELWSRGHPSRRFRYELSAWADLAKNLMLRQDQGIEHSLSFQGLPNGIPNAVNIEFSGLKIRCSISEEHWPQLVCSLKTVNSPLAVYSAEEEGIEKITYDPDRKELEVHARAEGEKRAAQDGISIGHWSFVPGDGFYADEVHELLQTPIVGTKQIARLLNEYKSLMRSYLVGTEIQEEKLQLKVKMAFNESWELQVDAYRQSPGDLDSSRNHHFGSWVYIDGEGFYPIAEDEAPKFHLLITPDGLPEFIVRHRKLFNTTPGFKLHLSSKDTYTDYRLSEDGMLFFENRLELDDEEESVDFGPWLYIQGEGFYSKTAKSPLPLDTHGQGMPAKDIPNFIRRHREDLRQVRDFFADECPVKACQLRVSVSDGERLLIEPQYILKKGYERARLHFFEDFVFTQGEGFSQIPADIRLPDGYFLEKSVAPAALEPFLEEEVPKIVRFLSDDSVLLDFAHNLKADVLSTKDQSEDQRKQVAVKLKYISEFGEVRAADVWSAIDKDQSYFFSEAGVIKLQQTRFDYLRELGEDQVDVTNNRLLVSTLELIRVDAFEELHPPNTEEEVWHPLLANIFDFDPNEKPPTRGLKSKLRSYQEIGFKWMWQLYRYQLSAMLCDDMGLGKTHQSMALLAAVKNFRKGQKPQFLVVCPTSVIYHWEDKLAEFLPSFKVHTYYGPNRTLSTGRKHYDILLTSYGVLRRDKEKLRSIAFEVAVFDEIQIAKNHLSAIHAALLKQQVNMRVGLTGTPIENRIRELKSLFDIVLPSYMPKENRYRDLFINPIEKEGDVGRQRLLSRLIQPFVLRRKKEDVLDDLPEKTEEVAHCELVEDQRQLYHEAIAGARTGLLTDLEDDDKNVSYTHIFALLTALKQICDHPAVYLKDVQGYKNYQSGKWGLFTELLKEARGSKQKVVVFSQYLGMMDIIEHYLHEHEIGFAGIRGATKDRAAQLKRFNEDPDCEVFVASLQAAGLGIDLTAASVVILYDRWWNAAREKQAIDRVHRIGQRRGVQVFKLVSKDTFEERIDEIIRNKGKLMEDVVGVDGDNFLKLLDRQDLLELLRDVEGS